MQNGQHGKIMAKVTFVCKYCGKEKTVYDNPNQSFKYCSTRCYHLSQGGIEGGMVEIVCNYCGIKKLVPHKEVLRGKHHYCSVRCANLSQDKIPPQEHNHTCEYNGTKFRSKGEVKYAEWCDVIGLRWEYEPSIFKLSDCCYIPDFYLLDYNKWVEIKSDVNDKEYKTREFMTNHSLDVLFRKDLNRIRRGLGYEWK